MDKVLYLLRGLPGAGKSALAASLDAMMYEADSFFYVAKDENGNIINRHQYDGVYEFDPNLIKEAHADCKAGVEDAMSWGQEKIAVSNTFTQKWEMMDYYKLAKKYDYTVFSLVVENRHGNVSVHDVPAETMDKMEKRFQIKLR